MILIQAYPGLSDTGRRLLSSTLNTSLTFNKRLEEVHETEILEGKNADLSMSEDNAAQVQVLQGGFKKNVEKINELQVQISSNL